MRINYWSGFAQKVQQLLNNFWGRFEMENETVLVKLRKIWYNIAKQHLNCMYTTYKLYMSLLWRLKICIITKWPKIRDVKLAIKKQFLGPIFPDLLNNFGVISNFWQFIKTVYCKVHREIREEQRRGIISSTKLRKKNVRIPEISCNSNMIKLRFHGIIS